MLNTRIKVSHIPQGGSYTLELEVIQSEPLCGDRARLLFYPYDEDSAIDMARSFAETIDRTDGAEVSIEYKGSTFDRFSNGGLVEIHDVPEDREM